MRLHERKTAEYLQRQEAERQPQAARLAELKRTVRQHDPVLADFFNGLKAAFGKFEIGEVVFFDPPRPPPKAERKFPVLMRDEFFYWRKRKR